MIRRNPDGSTSFEGPAAVECFRASVLASSLRLFAKTGIRPTRGVGPAKMMRRAEEITGQKFKARDYLGAADAVTAWARAAAESA